MKSFWWGLWKLFISLKPHLTSENRERHPRALKYTHKNFLYTRSETSPATNPPTTPNRANKNIKLVVLLRFPPPLTIILFPFQFECCCYCIISKSNTNHHLTCGCLNAWLRTLLCAFSILFIFKLHFLFSMYFL